MMRPPSSNMKKGAPQMSAVFALSGGAKRTNSPYRSVMNLKMASSLRPATSISRTCRRKAAAKSNGGPGGCGVGELRQPQLGLVLIVPIVESNDGNHMLASDRQQLFLFLPTGHAPGGPNVEYIDLALERRGAHGARRIEHIGKRELRRRLADQRRGQLVDVAVRVQAKREQHHQRDECRKRQQELPHQAAPSSGRGFGGDTAPGAATGTLTR